MRHRNKNKTLGRKDSSRKALLRDLVTAVITYDRIETSLGRAKVVKPLIDKMVTVAKKNNLAARRQLLGFFTTEPTVKKLLEVIAPKYATRAGGYTRLTKIGTRHGDAAQMAVIEFV